MERLSHDVENLPTGTMWINFPKQCALFKWNPDHVCGPYTNSVSPEIGMAMCCYGHKADDPRHGDPPLARGKPFHIADYRKEFEEKGIAVAQPSLKEEKAAGKPPPGTPKIVNGVKIYPARHFA